MLAAMAHRGPDGEGTTERATPAGSLVFGHRRLAIVDLSPSGRQPMRHAASGNELVFNGEIYGFDRLRARLEKEGEAFRGTSDTEVLLAALTLWGERTFDEIDGMYALAFFEARTQRLLLARDPCGIKPLYVAQPAPGELLFASETRAVLASGAVASHLDREALASFLAYGSVIEPRTIHAGIEALPRGSLRWYETGANMRATARRLWSPAAPRAGLTPEDAASQLRESLAAAVRTHLVADVPVSVFLSSGMDSAVLAGLVAKAGANVLGLTVGVGREREDETVAARESAARLGIEHEVLTVDEAAARAAVPRWLAASDQPSADGLNTFLVAEAVRARGFKVALSGLGADELFGGYASFARLPRLSRQLAMVPRSLGRTLGRMAQAPLALRMGRMRAEKFEDLLASRRGVATPLALAAAYFAWRRTLTAARLESLGLVAPDGEMPQGSSADPAWQISQLESTHYMGNTLLRDADVQSMAHGLEVRVPFLARSVLDLAASLPVEARMPVEGRRKELLWRAFAASIRPALAQEAKKGFSLPFATWLAGPLRDWREASLAALGRAGVVDAGGLKALLRDLEEAKADPTGARRMQLCVLGDFLGRGHSPRL